MNKYNLRNFMMVRDGLDGLYLVMLNNETHYGFMIRNYNEEEENNMTDEEFNESLPAYELSEFDDDLVHIECPVWSIVEVYDCLPIEPPFDLDVEDLFNHYKPQLLWKRDPSLLSRSKLESFETNMEKMNYIGSIVPPYHIVE